MRRRLQPTTACSKASSFSTDDPGAGRAVPELSQPAGELSAGNAGLHAAGSRWPDCVTTQISAFAPNFQTPYAEQANLSVQHEFGDNIVGYRQLCMCTACTCSARWT